MHFWLAMLSHSETLSLVKAFHVTCCLKALLTATLGPVIDGNYVRDLPDRLVLEGQYDHSLHVMTSHNQDEGSRFVPNDQVTTDAAYEQFIMDTFPGLARSKDQLDTVSRVLYPPIFDGSQGYVSQAQRANLTIADAVFVCSARVLGNASFEAPPFAYEYTVPPAIHGEDLAYTFYDFGAPAGLNTTVATTLQQYITNFALYGNPNARGLPQFSSDRDGSLVQNIGVTGIGPLKDEGGIAQLNARCQFWQHALYVSN